MRIAFGVIAALAVCLPVSSAGGDDYSQYYLYRRHLYEKLPGQSDVVMLGDSITKQCPWSEMLPGSLNRGINGDTTAGVLDRLDEVARRRPKVVFLLIGTNDLGKGISPDTVAKSIVKIKNRMLSSGAKVYVLSILYANTNNKAIAATNDLIRNIDGFVDLNAALAKGERLIPSMSYDGSHLGGDGCLVMRDLISPLTKTR